MYFANLLAVVGMTLLASQKVSAGGFGATCSNYFIQNNNFLVATCGDGRGGQTTSSINLNSCIGNDGHNLVCQANGNYAALGCAGCGIRTGQFMVCSCPSGSGIADLNECITNTGGLLTC